MMIEIKNLKASIEGKQVLKGVNLSVNKGEIHVIMGPNGTGKSTLAKVIAGDPSYEVDGGEVILEVNQKKVNLLDIDVEERSQEGVFLGFQQPIELPGISNEVFLQTAFNSMCEHQGAPVMDSFEFRKFLQGKMKALNMSEEFISRNVNEGFSGGEKKRNEILQLSILNPKVAFLDEMDSGLDVDSLRSLGAAVNGLRNKNNAFVLITHYKRLLEIVKPDKVHIFYNGVIAQSGGLELVEEVESKGYDFLSK